MDVHFSSSLGPSPSANPTPDQLPQSHAPATISPDLSLAWPRSAQWTVAALLTGVLLFFGARLWGGGAGDKSHPADPTALRVDLNRADRAELAELPGIGPALAARIDEYRHSHGPFTNIDDLAKVPGIGPGRVERLRPFVVVRAAAPPPPPAASPQRDSPPPSPHAGTARTKSKKEEALAGKTINVNEADLAGLQKLPGIGSKIGQRILDERSRRPFATPQELRRVPGIGPKTLEKILPYVIVGDAAVPLGEE